MRTTALLSLLSLWTEMTAVRAGRLITAAATGSELVSTAGSSCEPLGEGGQRARTGPGDSAVNGDFLPIFGFISFLECGHFHSTSGIAASCGAVSHLDESLTLFDEWHKSSAGACCLFAHLTLSLAGSALHDILPCVRQQWIICCCR
eukprot:SAG11_NODE_162_length_13962_cov_19.035562_11_plen_147_part_00